MNTKIASNNWRWLVSWQFFSFVLAISFGGIGFVATRALLNLPDRDNCSNLSVWFASATNRIYCAQLQAEKNTVEDLLGAIDLLKDLPKDHPLNHEFTRYIKEWSGNILSLAQNNLAQGNLESAIAVARQIPLNEGNKEIIEEKIQKWRDIWKKGQAIEVEVQDKLREAQWNQAFLIAVKLLNVNNEYWKDTRYREMVDTIELAKEESKQLDDAYVSVRVEGIDSFLKTIEIASEIPESSYSYNEAQKLIAEAEEGILKIATKLLDKKNWSKLIELANEISTTSELKSQAIDWKTLARAGKNVELGTISGVELAIVEAEQISSDSKIYVQARELIKDWSAQKEDIVYLASARNLARGGELTDLNAAIAKAKLVQQGNSIYTEAQQEIKSWRKEIQIIEDTPLLAQAQQFALSNTVQGWQSAISQANRISSNRALYSEARDLIREWRVKIETTEDRPILQKAIALGNRNKYQEAINAANGIGRGRTLYGEAQSQVRKWRIEIVAQQNLDTAYRIAQRNDEQSLLRAINLARRIPLSSSVGFQSRQSIDLWSERMLNIAQKMADTYSIPDLEKAIRVAQMIPRNNSAFNRAQQRIKQWKGQLYPSLNNNVKTPLQETDFDN